MERLTPGQLSARTREVYESNAGAFDAARSRALSERAWLDRMCADCPPGAAVLDLGCGTGEPVAGYLADAGFRVTGLDFAGAMIDIARARRPDGDWRLGDMRELNLERRFCAIVSWGSFFHLTPDQQRAALPVIARHLEPGGRLLLTVGPSAGETTGTVAGQTVYHASLAPGEYRRILESCGLRIEAFVARDVSAAGHTLLLARRIAEDPEE